MSTINTAKIFRVDIIGRRGGGFQIDFVIQDDQSLPVDWTRFTFECNVGDVRLIGENVIRMKVTSDEMAEKVVKTENYGIRKIDMDGESKVVIGGLFTVLKDYSI